MKILFASDIHAHEHEDFSYIDENGNSSRLADCLRVFDKISATTKRYGCEYICIAGDLFHTPRSVLTTTFECVYKAVQELARGGVPVVILAGNHDMARLGNSQVPASSVYAFSEISGVSVVVGRGETLTSKGVNLSLLPYAKDRDTLLAGLKKMAPRKPWPGHLLVTHNELSEAVNGPNEIRLKGVLSVGDLRLNRFEYCFAGHHHHPQRLADNCVVIGSPIQHNMLDRGDKRGLLVYDTETKKCTRIWSDYSNFHVVEVNSEDDFAELSHQNFSGSYVRFIVRSKGLMRAAGVAANNIGARATEVKLVLRKDAKIRSRALTNRLQDSSVVSHDVVKEFVLHIKPAGMNNERLIKLGRKLIDEVDGARA